MKKISLLLIFTSLFSLTISILNYTKENNLTNHPLSTKHPYIVLTGGPGSGKTSLLKALHKKNYLCIEETARAIIQQEVASNGDALPWKNTQLFRDKIFTESVKSYQDINFKGLVFFDRGILDCLAYSLLDETPISEEMTQAAKKLQFNKIVFVLPPWEDIYCNDDERTEDFQHSINIYNEIITTYQKYGYTTIDLPKKNVEERANFILQYLKNLNIDI